MDYDAIRLDTFLEADSCDRSNRGCFYILDALGQRGILRWLCRQTCYLDTSSYTDSSKPIMV